MTSSASPYSPLETLLVFKSLVQSHLPSAFDSISESLKADKIIRNGPDFNVAKFAPDALKSLYLGYMRDEVKNHTVTAGAQNGHAEDSEQPGTKKRRLESPEIETVEDAEKYRGRLPTLIGKLYARYRDGVIREVKEEEGRFKALEAEVSQLEKAAEDLTESINGASSNNADGNHGDATDSTRALSGDLSTPKRSLQPASPRLNDISTRPSSAQARPISTERSLIPNEMPSTVQRPDVKSESSSEKEGTHQAARPTKPQPILVSQDTTTRPSSGQPVFPVSGTPNSLPTSNQPTQGVPQPSPPRRPPPNLQLAQSQQIGQPPDASPPHSFAMPPNAPPRSPVILPPPPGMPLPSGSPHRSAGTIPDMNAHRRTLSSPTPAQVPYYSPTQQQVRPVPSPAGYPRQPYPAYAGQQSPYSTHVSPYANQPYPLQPLASRALPPPQGAGKGQTSIVGQVQGTPQQQYAPFQNRPTPQGYIPNQNQPFTGTPYNQGQHLLNRGQFHEWNASGRRETPRPPMLDTSFLSTPWKTPDRGYATTDPGSPSRPEEVSPISERGDSPLDTVGERKSTGKRGRGSRRGGRGGSVKRPSSKTRGTGSRNQRGSTASSAVGESARSRSQSLISHQDDSRTGVSRSTTTRKVKNEPPSTPAGILTDNDADVSAFSKDNTPRTSIRRKPGAPALFDPSTLPGGTNKRKRDPLDSADFDDSPPVTSTFPRPSFTNPKEVFTTRNFTRTCQHLMNEVTAHKHASIFAKPLTERDAPGYKDLIYRPQDLKSIKSAIHHGNKAVTAASESSSTPVAGDAGSPAAATPTKNALLTLPKAEDIIPPKGIVNSAQLEKELMRMFANAIMFNPSPAQERGFGTSFPLQRDIDWARLARQGTDNDDAGDDDTVVAHPNAPLGYQRFDDGGIVNDTREMFEDVERAVNAWRLAERGTLGEDFGMGGRGNVSKARGAMVADSMDDSIDELDGEVERETPTVGLGANRGDEEGTGTVAGRKRRRGDL